ncbi:conserved hypothetical protein [Verrucomicrobia bacterium]|nr:conserved hypothetical protein [Verrucomicrobiota bacterium]
MKRNYRQVPTRFGLETGFEVKPRPPAPFRAAQETRFEQLKKQLLEERLEEALEPGFGNQLRRAAQEAAALAWVTPYPVLFFPVLFEEKAQAAWLHAERQYQVRERSRELLAL